MKYFDMLLACTAAAAIYFEPAAEIGSTQKKVRADRLIFTGVVFFLIQLILTGIGIGSVLLFELFVDISTAQEVEPYLALIVLMLCGILIIRSAFQKKEVSEILKEQAGAGRYAKLAAEKGITAAAICFALYCAYKDWVLEAVAFPAVSLAVLYTGYEYGRRCGYKKSRTPIIIAGVLLCLFGLKTVLFM